LANYHSHPETPARPSDEDIRLVYDPNISYVIVSLAAGQTDVKSFRIQNGVVEKEEIEVY
jgi:proteasome lid subunit RPN8/RPN11